MLKRRELLWWHKRLRISRTDTETRKCNVPLNILLVLLLRLPRLLLQLLQLQLFVGG
jgi:hypothetical protein